MRKYVVQLNYNASIIVEVSVEDGNDAEGRALDKARTLAEEADIKEFTICGERESQILRQD